MKLKLTKKLIHLKTKLIALIIFLCLIVGIVMSFLIVTSINNHDVTSSTIIAEKLSKISELSTIKYSYSNIIALANSKKLNDIDIPFTEKSFLIKYSGYIKAGVDLKDLDIVIHNKKITITLKKAKILDHVVNDKDLFVYDEKSSIFNKLSMQDMVDEISNEKKNIEIDLLKTGFLEGANENTKLLLQGILSDMNFENVTIVFK